MNIDLSLAKLEVAYELLNTVHLDIINNTDREAYPDLHENSINSKLCISYLMMNLKQLQKELA